MKVKIPAVGQIAESLQGRDKGSYYVVEKVDGQFVYLVNGTTKKSDSPKKKNIKHVRFLPQAVEIKKDGAYNLKIADIIKNIKSV